MTFLQRCAERILATPDWQRSVVLVPNKRSVPAVRQVLMERMEGPGWLPQITTLGEWVEQQYPSHIVGGIPLQMAFFRYYLEDGEGDQGLEEVMQWCEAVLNDFRSLDNYLIEPNSFFRNLKDIKDIENWSFNSEMPLSVNQKKFMDFWEKHPTWYSGFRSWLQDHGLAYGAMAYRYLAENAEELFKDTRVPHFFIGFNALSEAERRIMGYFMGRGLGVFLPDYDAHYCENPMHEAGLFYRDLKENWPGEWLESPQHFVRNSMQQLHYFEGDNAMQECLWAASLVNAGKVDAIILADEAMMVPLMECLPADRAPNISMGYSLSDTPLRSLVDLCFDIQIDLNRAHREGRVHHKLLRSLLSHQMIAPLVSSDMLDVLRDITTKENQVFVHPAELCPRQDISELGVVQTLVSDWAGVSHWITRMHQGLNQVYQALADMDGQDLALDQLSRFIETLPLIAEMLEDVDDHITSSILRRVVGRHMGSTQLDLLGDRDQNVQVMGLLEARNLNFERILFLGMNEGLMPKEQHPTTHIPYDLQAYHKLPGQHEREAIYAHHFYRLLHHCKHLYLSWSAYTGGAKPMERSRYVMQIEYELEPSLTKENVFRYAPSSLDMAVEERPILQTESSLEVLHTLLTEKGLSPSSINKFLDCPRDFYYRYVLGIGEDQDPDEDIEVSTFGSLVHETLEEMYEAFLGRTVGSVELDGMLSQCDHLLAQRFEKHFGKRSRTGKIRYWFELGKSMLRHYLNDQKEELKTMSPPKILSVEKEFDVVIPIELDGQTIPLKVKGHIDRIEERDGEIRIIDYKSGKCEDKHVLVKKMEELDKPKRGVQLLLYALLLSEHGYALEKLRPTIYSLVSRKPGGYVLHKDGDRVLTVEDMQIVKEWLMYQASEMLQADRHFDHNPKAKFCLHCKVK